MPSWKNACAALGFLLAPLLAQAADNCTACHRVTVAGAHASLSCGACHGDDGDLSTDPSAAASAQKRCGACHEGHGGVLSGPMAHRSAERAFAAEAFGGSDPRFFEKSCASCHLGSCGDCHGEGHSLSRPSPEACHSCHRGYFTGADYLGRAPREDHLRYQRGGFVDGEAYLKMLPDVHFEAGMSCGACHTMDSLAAGEKAAKGCRDCHEPSPSVQEHRIAAHLEKLECYACHSAWGAQEYGTFFIRHEQSPSAQHFRVRWASGSEYIKSGYLKRQDLPPLGLNGAGRVSPIRPQFIVFTTHLREDKPVGEENRLLAARWKAFFPHTVRRGTPLCGACHENPRRFLLEPEKDRIFLPEKDGLLLPSFWDRRGQELAGGAFYPPGRFTEISEGNPAYRRGMVEKWKKLLDSVEPSSSR